METALNVLAVMVVAALVAFVVVSLAALIYIFIKEMLD